MKLRIRGDSIRLRLSQKEVAQILTGKPVQEATRFPGGSQFVYGLAPSDSVSHITADFQNQQMWVRVPMTMAKDWAQSQQVGMKFEDNLDSKATDKLFILIEKDFACLKPRENENEDESDLFANPNQSHGNCR